MTANQIKRILLWCVGINYAVLLVWFLAFVYGHDSIYQLHSHWFRLSVETFDAAMYAAMAVYKIGIILLNVVPLVALYLTP